MEPRYQEHSDTVAGVRDIPGITRASALWADQNETSRVPDREQSDDESPIKLYIVHQHPMIAESLGITLGQAPDIEVVGVSTTADQSEDHVVKGRVDVLLLDASLDRDRLTDIVCATSSAVKIVVIAREHDPDLMLHCVQSGAVGFMIEPQRLADLAFAVRCAHQGWLVLTREQILELTARSRARVTNPHAAALCERLNARERDVLSVLVTGASSNEVARRLLIAPDMVQSHIKHAMRKLAVRSKMMSVVLALAGGIIDVPDLTPSPASVLHSRRALRTTRVRQAQEY
jgi:DNA-binding NarL/FixJ family response regulator